MKWNRTIGATKWRECSRLRVSQMEAAFRGAAQLIPAWDFTNLSSLHDTGWGVGVVNGTPYRRPPMTGYQRAARRNTTGVTDHLTQYPPSFILDLCVNVRPLPPPAPRPLLSRYFPVHTPSSIWG